ncbi:rabenosyn-5 [Oncorhynchus kisutch]|uniref:Rabenosyn, RAB effector n=1 Tax=Oncorhynchus kisutch TaxID=8019 RepID=A0A8C7J7S8_ONCKI|nr:rabenosyn-5 [Oncorhynchus kisutch]XP_020361493.1 rabenosyn-5 [Oncorhynchus kisutch]XP_031649773.1 rabenosyn-5 [Oncorhynchus kisutch]
MASSYPPPFEGTGEVKEGFLCPLCLKDLQSFYQLQEHYEEEHSGDDRHVRGQLKSLVQKAKKAKDKLLKRDGEDKPETGSYESFYYGGVDPYMWEPQELGATRNHMDFFKKHRAARIDHYVIEVNKLIIRLEKLTSFDRMNIDAGKIRAIEKSVVAWVSDSDVPFCPDCGNKFNLRNRRHHCRLCGSIMCRKCMEFVPLPLAYKLTSGTREAHSVTGSQSQSPATGGGGNVSGMGSRRGSISSLSSVTSMLEEKDDERIRCCLHCMDTLMKRQQKLEEKDHVPDIVKLYQRLRLCMDKVDERAPEYIRMAESLNAGETTYNLDTAGGLRMEVQKYYELIDALSKKILTLGMKEEPQPHQKTLQLQRMVRYTATLFVQEKLLGLMSLPTKDKYEDLKEKRKQEQEKRLTQERLIAQVAQKRRQDSEKNRPAASTNGEAPQAPRAPRMTKAGGWLPSSDTLHTCGELEDPLLQQIDNIQSFLRQAKAAQRHDEVAMLEENLRQLQDEYDQQQTSLAIALSQRLAQEESLQQDELQRLEDREREHRAQSQAPGSQATYTWQGSLNLTDIGSLHGEEEGEEEVTPKAESSPLSMRAFPALTDQDEESPPRLRRLRGDVTPPGGEGQNSSSLNPFEEEDSTPVEDPSNPFFEEIQKEHKEVANGKKEYNPFEQEEGGEEEEEQGQAEGATGNPFEVKEENNEGNPFKEASGSIPPGASTNPFEGEDEEAMPDVDVIEEELLLQQIDNIRAYIFDAKLNGRLDEVELLSENLRELQRTLQEQKSKTH